MPFRNVPIFYCVFFLFLNCFCCHALKKDETQTSKIPEILNLPPRNEQHIKREIHLKNIETELKKLKGYKILTLAGMAGVGKTHLAKEYAHSHLKDYNMIWWIDANQDLVSQLRELGQKLNTSKGCTMPPFKEKLQEKWLEAIGLCSTLYFSKTLFIIDDAKSQESIKPISQALPKAHIILTSRNPSIGKGIIQLKGFTRQESLEYLGGILIKHPQSSINELAETLGDYPMALGQAATYFDMLPSISIEEYIKLYKNKKKLLWKEEGQLMSKNNKNQNSSDSYKTISSSFTLLLDQVKQDQPYAFDLLKFSSFLGSQDIPKEFLKKWMIDVKKIDDFEFHKALSLLIKRSIFEKSAENESLFNIHSLLQEFIRDSLEQDERKKYLEELSEIISSRLPDSSSQVWKILFKDRNLEYHLSSLIKIAKQYEYVSKKLLTLKIKHFHFLHFFKSEGPIVTPQMNDLTNDVKHCKDLPDLEKGRFLILSANISTLGSNCDKATALSEEAEVLLTHINTQAAKEELFFLLVNNLMDYYNLKGDLQKAEQSGKKAEMLLPYIKDPNYIALYYFIRSTQLMNKGDYREALRHIDISIGHLPSTDFPPYVPFFKQIIKSEILAKLGELKEASALAEKNYKGLLKIYPKRVNYKILKTKIGLAFISLKLGKLEKSFQIIQSVFEGLKTFYKNPYEGPLQAFPHLILGEIYEAQNKLPQALEQYRQAEDIYSHIYKTIEVDDLCYLYKNFVLLGEKMKDEFTIKKYLQLMIDNFGMDHSRTKEAIQYLDDQDVSVFS